ncbi:dihydroorotase [Haloparvum sedimenti]|uniref:dihydroorotase n=1 Tax=Haloparvum sedimenti TaxID=1678448 RepID=UPI00071E7CB3|nr:dihydroorotase [Haloparvum sedimenti]
MLITGAELADGRVRDVRVRDGEFLAVESGIEPEAGERVVDARGRTMLPGAVDVHVHFREPGGSHKETWTTGSRAAAAGGVTTVVDQPNTSPPTVDGDAFAEKAALADGNALVDYGLNGGVTAEWDPDALFDAPLLALGEVFLADSTGEMGIDADLFAEAVAAAAEHDVPVTVHAEDATLFDDEAMEGDLGGIGRAADADRWSAYRTATAEAVAVERAIETGIEAGGRIHVAHTSTPEGIDAVAEAAADGAPVTCEVTPHHLFLSRADAGRLGTYGRMNPPLRSTERRQAVFERLRDGTVDVVATDHAPHTVAEKEQGLAAAPSGVPGVETMLPLLLASVRQGDLPLERVRDVTAANPAAIFGLDRKGRIEAGRDADFVLVDLATSREIEAGALHSKARWTPFEGWRGVFPELTVRRGDVVYERDPVTGSESFGAAEGRNVRER